MDLHIPLPWSITLDSGRRIKLYASFDRVLAFLDVLRGKSMTEDDTEKTALFLLFGDQRLTARETQEALAKAQKILFEPQKAKDSGPRVMDFHQDAALILAAFRQAYGIDLYHEQGRLHWLEFLALLSGIPQNTRLSEVMEIRACKVPPATKNNHEQVRVLMRAKAKYAIRITEEERQTQWQAGLQNIAKHMCISGTVGWMGGESADKSIRDMIDRFGTSQNPGSGLDIAYKMLEQ